MRSVSCATLTVSALVTLLAMAPGAVAAQQDAQPGEDDTAAPTVVESAAESVESSAGPVDAAIPQAPTPREETELESPVVVRGDRFIMTGSLTVPADQVRYGDIVTVGGSVRVDGRVRGSVVAIGGQVDVTGRVDHEVIAVLTDTQLRPGSRVDRGLVSVLGDLDDDGASVRGDYVNIPLGLSWPGTEGPFRILLSLWLWTKAVVIVLVFLGILVIVAMAPDRVERLADEASRRALLALLIGAPTCILGFPLLFLLLTASVIGLLAIPVAILAAAALVWLGYAGLFQLLGHRLGRLVGRDMSVLGSTLLGFLVFALIWFIPIVGFMVWTVLTWIATGLLITGRMGGAPQVPDAPPAIPSTGPRS